MSCVADECRQGRIACTRTECGYAQAESEPLPTPEQAMTWPSLALTLVLAAVLAAVVVALVTANWPLFVWAASL